MKYFIVLIVLFLSFSSCKSSKNIVNNTTSIKEMSARRVVKKHISSNFDKKNTNCQYA